MFILPHLHSAYLYSVELSELSKYIAISTPQVGQVYTTVYKP